MTKALFFDIDGTLVSFKTHAIPASAIRALAEAKAKGHRIFIATGRPPVIINNLSALQERNLIDGYVTMNGSYCFIGDQVVYKRAIPPEEAKAVIDFCTARKRACVVVGEREMHVCHPDRSVQEIFHDFLKVDKLPEITPEEAFRIAEIFQLTPFVTTAEEQEMFRRLSHCESGRWYPAFADITAKGNTKQKGIDEIIRPLGIRLEDTLSFGDGGNDISMLRHAGAGIAMGDANDEVKAAADYVTASIDEDGIEKALLHFGIIG